MLPLHPHSVLVLDLDDTLLRSDETISDRTLTALNRWRKAGNAIIIATGRPTRSIANVLPDDLHSVPWITYNGAYIYLDGQCIYENLIPSDVIHTIIRLVNETVPDCTMGLEIDNKLFANRTINRAYPY